MVKYDILSNNRRSKLHSVYRLPIFFLRVVGYEGAPSFPVDFAKYVHDLLSKHHKTGVTSGNPILIS